LEHQALVEDRETQAEIKRKQLLAQRWREAEYQNNDLGQDSDESI